ncbi:MAG TPA: biotin transporter BioY [Dehalococcoidia bacterium]|nr:biotin transporter BioY [Dehalococcoidia bacterium]
MKESTVHPTFVDVAIPGAGILRDVGLVVGFACLTAAFAQISFWIGPVPVTGQTFAVLLAGALLGARRGALSQLSYLAIGATGIPYWFALGGPPGMARLLGPTGGYLLGFVAAAFVVGWLVERGWDRRVPRAAAAMFVGNGVIYIFGLPWLAYFVPVETLLQVGLYPFIVGDLVKIAAAASVLPSGWMLLHRFKG